MIGSYVEITGTLKVLTALKVRTGTKKVHEDIVGTDEASAPLVADVAQDYAGEPYSPGLGLKGVLRRFATSPASLFGPEEIGAGSTAKSGKTIFRNAYFSAGPTGAINGLKNRKAVDNAKGLIVEARIAKNTTAGVAGKGTLFHSQQVLPGTAFKLSLAVFDMDHADKAELIGILKCLAQADGIGFGKHTNQGMGRVQLDPESICVVYKGLGQPSVSLSDWPAEIAKSAVPKQAKGQVYRLHLSSEVPFLIHDPLRERQTNDKTTPHLQALMDYDGKGPRLTGASLLGALRAGFAYYESDGRERQIVAAGTRFDGTSATERLFGDVGWKGRVEIVTLAPFGQPIMQKIMSVKLDRFSGAPMDNALFGTEGWRGCLFDLQLRLTLRDGLKPEEDALLANDDTLFADYLAELCSPVWGGLQLGHSGNKGFGWFTLEMAT